jgi:hypothetical protein
VGAGLDRIAVGAASDAASTGFCGRSSLGAASAAGAEEPAGAFDSAESPAPLTVDPDGAAPVEVGAAVGSSVPALEVGADVAAVCFAAADFDVVVLAAVVLAVVFEVVFFGDVVRAVVRLAAVVCFTAGSASDSEVGSAVGSAVGSVAGSAAA